MKLVINHMVEHMVNHMVQHVVMAHDKHVVLGQPACLHKEPWSQMGVGAGEGEGEKTWGGGQDVSVCCVQDMLSLACPMWNMA